MVQSYIRSLPQAFEVIKQMDLSSEGEVDYRVHARQSVVEILRDRMEDRLDRYLEEMGCSCLCPACFVLGISTRKVAHALMPILGEAVSATTVSRVARILDRTGAAFHQRSLTKSYRFLVFDGIVLKRKTGVGSVKRGVLVALGITPGGKTEVIDFRVAHAESQSAWEVFLAGLYDRRLRGEGTELLITNGGKGLLAAFAALLGAYDQKRHEFSPEERRKSGGKRPPRDQ